MSARRLARTLVYLGLAGIVVGLSKVHAAFVAEPTYDYTGSARFSWSIAYIGALCIAAYGFLVRERTAIPPSASGSCTASSLSERARVRRTADPARTPRRELDRDAPKTALRRSRQNPRKMPVLSDHASHPATTNVVVTQ